GSRRVGRHARPVGRISFTRGCDERRRPIRGATAARHPRDPVRRGRFMIYMAPDGNAPIDQADLVDGCPVLSLEEYDPDAQSPPLIQFAPTRVVVLTQPCDLGNRKTTVATIAVVHEAQFLIEQGLIKPADVRGPIRAGRVFGWYFLPASSDLGLPEM